MTLTVVPPPSMRPLPHNIEAEKSVLGSVFIRPAIFVDIASGLDVDDFLQPEHREIFDAMLAIYRRGQPLDVLSVADELQVRGQAGRLEGGAAHLVALADVVPTAENALNYVRLVREKATLRRLIAACAGVVASANGDVPDVAEFLDEARAAVESAVARSASQRQTLLQWVQALAAERPQQRILTPWDPLNRATRGLRAGVVILAALPGAGKTVSGIQIAVGAAARGIPVCLIAADQGVTPVVLRLGQSEGIPRAALDDRDPAAFAELTDLVQRLPALEIVDGVTVGHAARELRRRSGGGPAVLIADSIHRARSAAGEEAETARDAVEAVVADLVSAGKDGITAIGISEVGRIFYRNGVDAAQMNPIAAAKESGAIEYAADLLIVLKPAADGTVEAKIAKSRWGELASWRARIDPIRGTLDEVPGASGDTEPHFDSATQLDLDIEAARGVLRANPGIAGTERLRASLIGMSAQRRHAAVRALKDGGEVMNQGTTSQPRLHLNDGALPGLTGLTGRAVTPPLTPLTLSLERKGGGEGPAEGAPGDEGA